jgi:hypothetical protein
MNHSRLRKKRRPPGISDRLVLSVIAVYIGGCKLLGIDLAVATVSAILVPFGLMLLIIIVSGIGSGFR